MDKNSLIHELCHKLGYTFHNVKLLKKALTHRSSDDENNERLEFLGDSIVNFIIAEVLYHEYPHAQEGALSRWRATLINREALGNLARQFEMGRFLILGYGELKSGGGERQSILSCAMEAIIGAIYLDGGFEAVQERVLHWFKPYVKALSHASHHKDPKTLLQEYLQSHRLPLPIYKVESVEGKAHQQTFIVSCAVDEVAQKAIGKGTSRRRAEQHAAELMLGILTK